MPSRLYGDDKCQQNPGLPTEVFLNQLLCATVLTFVYALYSKSLKTMNDLTDIVFEKYKIFIFRESGINLSDEKRELLRTRLLKRLQVCGFTSYSDYLRRVQQDPKELVCMLDAISTNLTSFFREPKHFEFLNSKLLPDLLLKKRKANSQKIRVWSSGASTGEEPYSLMMTILEHIDKPMVWDIKLLGTDINTEVLAKARDGVYTLEKLKTVPSGIKHKYFQNGRGNSQGLSRVKDSVKKLIYFKRLNLMDERYPFSGPFDFIFCRNVMIYFNRQTQEKLVNRYYDYLSKGGCFFIGHSESLTGIQHKFSYVQPTIYRKD